MKIQMSNPPPLRQNEDVHALGRLLSSTGKVHQKQEVWGVSGFSPTVIATAYKEPIKIVVERKVKNGIPDAEADG